MADDRPLYVVCDTNAAARDAHLFRKKGGPLLIAMLRAKKAKLLVPDVLRMEYIKQFALAGEEALQKATKELDRLKTLCGYDMGRILPSSQFGDAQALEILVQLEDVIFDVPVTPELKLAAADRLINGLRPTSKTDHGFKDCLIWECILSLPPDSEVMLLSRDEAAFFDKEGVLAPSLAAEADAKNIRLSAYSSTREQTLMPLVKAFRERFEDISALAAGDLALDDHPVLQAHMQRERVQPALPRDGGQQIAQQVIAPAGELDDLLAAELRPLTFVDAKALGFVGFLRSTGKQAVVRLLVQSGVAVEVARNALERLALAGLTRDTGSNYLAVESALTEKAVQLVELEMIRLTGYGG